MNRVLAETLSILNGLFAFVTVLAGGIIGKYLGPYCFRFHAQLNGLVYTGSDAQAEAFGVIIGLAVGFSVAVSVFGLLALFIQMHRELKAIHRRLAEAERLEAPEPHALGRERIVPTLGTQP